MRRRAGSILLAAALVGCLPAPTSAAGAAPAPPAPSDAVGAQTSARAAARQVASARAHIAAATARLQSADRMSVQAQHSLDAQLGAQAAARTAVQMAAARVESTRARYAGDRRSFADLITVQYESGGGMDGAGSLGRLLSAPDPGALMQEQQDAMLFARFVADVVARDRVATRAEQAAQSRLSAALAHQREATAVLLQRRDDAQHALTSARRDLSGLHHELAAARSSQAQADAVLSRFLGGWSVADPARADALNHRYLQLALQAGTAAGPGRAHRWSAARGRSAAWRAVLRVGTPYAWAGGSRTGPTPGICTGGGAENDCHVTGFDCSGLALYGWAPYLALPHLAAAQYAGGRTHPAVTDLLPGDLVFWSSDGQVGGIHHVAIYVGDGNVVQAPESGDIVRITPLASVDAGYFGATRPLT